MESKDPKEIFKVNKKEFKLSCLINVIKYSLHGFGYFYKYERSAWIHLLVTVLIVFGSINLKLTKIEWLFMIFILLTMLAIELVNTAIEQVCDLVSPGYNKHVKVAKDCASAATFSVSIGLLVALLIIYVPKIIHLLGY